MLYIFNCDKYNYLCIIFTKMIVRLLIHTNIGNHKSCRSHIYIVQVRSAIPLVFALVRFHQVAPVWCQAENSYIDLCINMPMYVWLGFIGSKITLPILTKISDNVCRDKGLESYLNHIRQVALNNNVQKWTYVYSVFSYVYNVYRYMYLFQNNSGMPGTILIKSGVHLAIRIKLT